MAYTDSNWKIDSVRSIIRDTFRFEGRSARTEGIVYYILIALVGAVLNFAEFVFFPPEFGQTEEWQPSRLLISDYLLIPAQLPLISWFVRRLHDQDRSGWFVLLWPLEFAVVLFLPAGKLAWAFGYAIFALLAALVFWPPSPDENRYGLNPRRSSA